MEFEYPEDREFFAKLLTGGDVKRLETQFSDLFDFRHPAIKRWEFDKTSKKVLDPETLNQARIYEPNQGWVWDGEVNTEGITWGGCLESIDELLRHGVEIPSLEDFENIVLITETSEEIPSADYVFRVYRALGERGILARIRGILVGRPKAWEFNKQQDTAQKDEYRKNQRETILKAVRAYNPTVPVIQNLDFGHTDPQIAMPYGMKVRIDSENKRIFVSF